MTRPDPEDLPIALDPLPPSQAEPARRIRKSWFLPLMVPLLMFTGAVIGMYFQPPGLRVFYAMTGLTPGGGSSDPIALPPEIALPHNMAETLRPSDVIGLARLMPKGDISIIAAPYGAGDARVLELLVAEGDKVEKGQVVARLDNLNVLEGAVLLAEANLAIREASLMQTRTAVMNSRDEAQATLEQARSIAAEAASETLRSEELFSRNVISRSMLDTVRASEQQAAAAVTKAEATLARFTSIGLDDQPDVVVAARNLAAAGAELERARRDLLRSDVMAPISGTILDILATPGQRPPTEGIMTMGDTTRMMAEVEIWQDRISQVRIGQPVDLAASALGTALQGQVSAIGLTVGRQGLLSDDTAANTDARVIRVMVRLDEPSSRLASRFVNLEVIARIDTDWQPE